MSARDIFNLSARWNLCEVKSNVSKKQTQTGANHHGSAPDTATEQDEQTSANEAVQDAVADVDDAQGASPETQPDDPSAELRAEAQRNLEGWQRTLAEFQNYRRRTDQERQELRQRAALDTLTRILPIIDDFERALDNKPAELEDHPWLAGVSLMMGKFTRLLEEYHVEVIDPVGQPFDPNLHQAVSMDDSDEVESGHVIETLQKGYISDNHLLRAAIVRVAN